MDNMGRGACKMISDFNKSFTSQNFVNAVNERASFVSCTYAFKTTTLVEWFEYASN